MNAPRGGSPKYAKGLWAWSNWGRVMGIAMTRTQAIEEVQKHTGKTWAESNRFMEVWRCDVVLHKRTGK